MSNAPRPVIAGNWKMHHGPRDTRRFFREFNERHAPLEDRRLIFFPPAISLLAAVDASPDRPDLSFGVQNIHWEDSGAYTGEISARMAREAGARYALVGHSERRHVFGETDDEVRRKVAAAAGAGLVPVICLGETLDERRAGRLEEVILRQLDAATETLDDDALRTALIAYEPVWAIGTGQTATPRDADAAHAILRDRLARRLDREAASSISILYGGSAKPDNAAELLAAPGVDGLLVGGASLDPVGFARIAAA